MSEEKFKVSDDVTLPPPLSSVKADLSDWPYSLIDQLIRLKILDPLVAEIEAQIEQEQNGKVSNPPV